MLGRTRRDAFERVREPLVGIGTLQLVWEKKVKTYLAYPEKSS